MNIHRLIFSAIIFTVPFTAFAGWQVSKTDAAPTDPFFQGAARKPDAYVPSPKLETSQSSNFSQAASVYAVSISGSLKENIERIMGRYHWKVVWKAPYDYNFDGRVTGYSLPNVVEKILEPFPLQAVMYMANRTIAISPKLRA